MSAEQTPWKSGEAMTFYEVDVYYGNPPEGGAIEMPRNFDYFCEKDESGTSAFDRACVALNFTNHGNSIREHSQYIDSAIYSDDVHEQYSFHDLRLLHATGQQLEYLQALNREVAQCILEPNRDPRRAYTSELFQSFAKDRSSGPWVDNFAETVEFLCHYKQELAREIEQRQLPAKLEQWRQQFADFIGSPSARRIVGIHSAERAAYAARTVPIVIADPLSALVRRSTSDGNMEILGQFVPTSRRVTVDPFTADIFARRRRSQELPDMELRSSLYHELIHSFTADHYTKTTIEESDFDQLGNATVTEHKVVYHHRLWPKFWNEGMTEKFAGYITGVLAEPEELSYSNYDPEPADRAAVSLSPKELLLSRQAARIRGAEDFGYFDYRLLIDTTFAKLDWEGAGLTERQAETLAAHAFAEAPEDNSSKRLEFIQAVNKASHPGFFMKLQHIVDLYGTGLAMDMMSSPDFDPHNPQALPFIATKQMATDVIPEDLEEFISLSEYRCEQYKDIKPVYESESKRLEHMRARLARHNLLQGAIEGQRVLLEHGTPAIVHQDPSERRLMLAMFGKEPSLSLQSRAKSIETLAKARAAIARWVHETVIMAHEWADEK